MRRRHAPPRIVIQSIARLRGEDGLRPPRVHVRLRQRDQLQVARVRFLRRGAPGHGAVVEEDEAQRVRVRPHRLADFLREQEAGAAVGDAQHAVAERIQAGALRIGRVDQRQHRVRVRVEDAGGGDEGVQQRLDGRPRRRGLRQAAGQVRHHLLVRHVAAVDERQHVVQPHAGEIRAADGRQVRPAPLDPQHAQRPAEHVLLIHLYRGVAAAAQHERRVRPHRSRVADAGVQRVLGGDGRVEGDGGRGRGGSHQGRVGSMDQTAAGRGAAAGKTSAGSAPAG